VDCGLYRHLFHSGSRGSRGSINPRWRQRYSGQQYVHLHKRADIGNQRGPSSSHMCQRWHVCWWRRHLHFALPRHWGLLISSAALPCIGGRRWRCRRKHSWIECSIGYQRHPRCVWLRGCGFKRRRWWWRKQQWRECSCRDVYQSNSQCSWRRRLFFQRRRCICR
jgi:hypothetical protein